MYINLHDGVSLTTTESFKNDVQPRTGYTSKENFTVTYTDGITNTIVSTDIPLTWFIDSAKNYNAGFQYLLDYSIDLIAILQNLKVVKTDIRLNILDIINLNYFIQYTFQSSISYFFLSKIINLTILQTRVQKVELIKLLETQVFTPTKFLISSSTDVAGGVEVYNSTLNTSFSVGTGNQNRGSNCMAIGDNIMIPASCENVTVIGSNVSVPENTSGFSYINGTVTNSIYNEKALIQNKSANYNVKAYDDVVFMTTGATNKTVTLSYGQIGFLESSVVLNINDVETTLEYGKQITIKKVDSGAGNVIIDGNGALIDGAATITLTTQYESVTLQWDGTNWNKL